MHSNVNYDSNYTNKQMNKDLWCDYYFLLTLGAESGRLLGANLFALLYIINKQLSIESVITVIQ